MNETIAKQLKEKLEQEKIKLEKELETFAVEDKNLKGNWDAKPINTEDTDMEEKAGESEEYSTKVSLEHSLELKLKEVNTALDKISGSGYGLCEKCGKEIEEQRLMAAPEARFCINCNKWP